ncbi:MAG: hypothetical protein D3908_05895, partial [Candidatus Electrothrix sp. AUS4]|nr:hypothetical protein [Candidatus Electrothrix sp. AUS4]
MHSIDPITAFYLRHVSGAKLQNKVLTADCPLCSRASKATDKKKKSGENALVIFLNPDSYFHGYYRCLNRCSP